MATIPLQKARWSHGDHLVVTFPEAASQSFKSGNFVTLNTSGQILLAPDDAIYAVGMALQDASGTTNGEVLVLLATTNTFFSANYTTTDAGAVTAQTIVGDIVGIGDGNTNGFHTVESNGTAAVKIIELDKRDAVGDTGGRVIFVFTNAKSQVVDAAQDDDGV